MITDDDIYEGDEYFTLSVVDPPGFENFTKSITIQDNEGMYVTLLSTEVTSYYIKI